LIAGRGQDLFEPELLETAKDGGADQPAMTSNKNSSGQFQFQAPFVCAPTTIAAVMR
jgi:hypothetical protein